MRGRSFADRPGATFVLFDLRIRIRRLTTSRRNSERNDGMTRNQRGDERTRIKENRKRKRKKGKKACSPLREKRPDSHRDASPLSCSPGSGCSVVNRLLTKMRVDGRLPQLPSRDSYAQLAASPEWDTRNVEQKCLRTVSREIECTSTLGPAVQFVTR